MPLSIAARIARPAEDLRFLKNGFRVDGDFDEVADDNAAAVERGVPVCAKVVAVDGGGRQEAGAGFGALVLAILPPGRLPLAEVGYPKLAGAGDAANGQVTENGIVVVTKLGDLAAAEGDGFEMLDVEKVGAAQMGVAIRLAGPEPRGVDLNFHRGALRMRGIEVDLAVDVFEVPADVGDHHVAYAEFRGSVAGL